MIRPLHRPLATRRASASTPGADSAAMRGFICGPPGGGGRAGSGSAAKVSIVLSSGRSGLWVTCMSATTALRPARSATRFGLGAGGPAMSRSDEPRITSEAAPGGAAPAAAGGLHPASRRLAMTSSAITRADALGGLSPRPRRRLAAHVALDAGDELAVLDRDLGRQNSDPPMSMIGGLGGAELKYEPQSPPICAQAPSHGQSKRRRLPPNGEPARHASCYRPPRPANSRSCNRSGLARQSYHDARPTPEAAFSASLWRSGGDLRLLLQ